MAALAGVVATPEALAHAQYAIWTDRGFLPVRAGSNALVWAAEQEFGLCHPRQESTKLLSSPASGDLRVLLRSSVEIIAVTYPYGCQLRTITAAYGPKT